MQEPWTGVIRDPSNHHLLVLKPSGHYIPAHGIEVVEGAATSTLYDIKAVLHDSE